MRRSWNPPRYITHVLRRVCVVHGLPHSSEKCSVSRCSVVDVFFVRSDEKSDLVAAGMGLGPHLLFYFSIVPWCVHNRHNLTDQRQGSQPCVRDETDKCAATPSTKNATWGSIEQYSDQPMILLFLPEFN